MLVLDSLRLHSRGEERGLVFGGQACIGTSNIRRLDRSEDHVGEVAVWEAAVLLAAVVATDENPLWIQKAKPFWKLRHLILCVPARSSGCRVAHRLDLSGRLLLMLKLKLKLLRIQRQRRRCRRWLLLLLLLLHRLTVGGRNQARCTGRGCTTMAYRRSGMWGVICAHA